MAGIPGLRAAVAKGLVVGWHAHLLATDLRHLPEAERVTVVAVTQVVTDCPDPKDNMFLALADTAQAELLVSSDPHLVDMHPWRNIPILPPAAFLVGIR